MSIREPAMTWRDIPPPAELEPLIKSLLEEYVDGTPFFDALDHSLGTPAYFEYGMARARAYLASQARPGEKWNLVVSGHFGRGFHAWFSRPAQRARFGDVPEMLVLPGSLRHAAALPLDHLADHISGRRFVFFDDTMYKARTRDLIAREIAAQGGGVEWSFILYDGSAPVRERVSSGYRYFDHYDEQGHPRVQREVSGI